MISVGIDVSKGKSTICAMKPYGEILLSPKEYKHTKPDLDALYQKVSCFKEEIHFVMEATGTYHLPVSSYLKEKGYEVIIVNPLEMKRYRCQGIRNPKYRIRNHQSLLLHDLELKRYMFLLDVLLGNHEPSFFPVLIRL